MKTFNPKYLENKMNEIVPYKDLQEAFTKAYLGLAAQGFTRSFGMGRYGSSCLYRASDGKKCAVGHLIPDELYDPEVNSIPFWSALDCAKGWKKLFQNISKTKLAELQDCHDKATIYTDGSIGIEDDPEKMKTLLANFAVINGLIIPEMKPENMPPRTNPEPFAAPSDWDVKPLPDNLKS
jgi:hypothetical protein